MDPDNKKGMFINVLIYELMFDCRIIGNSFWNVNGDVWGCFLFYVKWGCFVVYNGCYIMSHVCNVIVFHALIF